MNEPYRILHIITGLQVGGAEMALYRLVSTLDPKLFQHVIISLTDDQPVGGLIRKSGFPVISLGFHSGSFDPRIFFQVRNEILKNKPDIVQTWMYHADLVGGIAAKLAGAYPVVWNIRHTLTEKGSLKTSTYRIVKTNAWLSHFIPTKIICNANTGKETHLALGFAAGKLLVIENGFDLSQFAPDKDSKRIVCNELELPANACLVGMAARYNPQKDHSNFIQAAALLLQKRGDVYFLLWGNHVDHTNATLTGLIRSLNLQAHVFLLGLRMDTQQLFSALDISTLSSADGEAFPQVIGEAMACGVPCVVTDVGDSANIVDRTGRIVPPRDPHALARAWEELLSLPEADRIKLGIAARGRIKDLFSLETATQKYSRIYLEILKKPVPT
jgi:glycosyltransferase involved in cell wall biosynthesis